MGEGRTAGGAGRDRPNAGLTGPAGGAVEFRAGPRHTTDLPRQGCAISSNESSAGSRSVDRAIVLDDVGVNRAHAEAAINLPAEITLSFMTYADGVAGMAARAHARGHELMVHVPMEPLGGKNDPGPNALMVDLSDAEILRRLFNEDDVRLFEPAPAYFRCRCSRERVAGMLRALGEAESRSVIAERGAVEVSCDFCNRTYVFDAVDVEQLFKAEGGAAASSSVH